MVSLFSKKSSGTRRPSSRKAVQSQVATPSSHFCYIDRFHAQVQCEHAGITSRWKELVELCTIETGAIVLRVQVLHSLAQSAL